MATTSTTLSNNTRSDNDRGIISQENVGELQTSTGSLLEAVDMVRRATDEDSFSPERVSLLQDRKNNLVSQNRALNNRKNILENRIAHITTSQNDTTSSVSPLNTALESGSIQQIPNPTKINKIKYWVSEHRIERIEFHLTDGSKNTHGANIGSIANNRNYRSGEIELTNNNDFIISIDVYRKISSNSGPIGNALLIKTSNKPNGHKISGTSIRNVDTLVIATSDSATPTTTPTPTSSPSTTNKEFKIDTIRLNKVEHKARAESQGWKLASIANESDLAKVKQLVATSSGTYAYTGGERIDGGANPGGKDSGVWKWSDGTPWVNIGSGMWGPNQPNGTSGGIALIMAGTGLIDHADSNRIMGVYSRQVSASAPAPAQAPRPDRYTKDVLESGHDKQIIGLTDFLNLTLITPTKKYIDDTTTQDTYSRISEQVTLLINNCKVTNSSLQSEIQSINSIIATNNTEITFITNEINRINTLNSDARTLEANMNSTDGFINMENNNIFNNLYNYFKNILINNKEGMSGNTSTWNEIFNRVLTRVNNSAATTQDDTRMLEFSENRNYLTELLAQKDQISNNILMDYLINEEAGDGSNVRKVYQELDQKNKDNMRKIQINNYNMKSNVEYSYLLKIIIMLALIMIVFLFLAKKEVISMNLSLSIIIGISFLGFLYILYRLYLLYIRDENDFDKFKSGYDRQASELIKSGKLKNKTGLSDLGITCIGSECCSDGMTYDATLHRCVPISAPQPLCSDEGGKRREFYVDPNGSGGGSCMTCEERFPGVGSNPSEAGFILSTGRCVEQCPTGTERDSTTGICVENFGNMNLFNQLENFGNIFEGMNNNKKTIVEPLNEETILSNSLLGETLSNSSEHHINRPEGIRISY